MHTHISRILATSALAFGLSSAHAASVNGVTIPEDQITNAMVQARMINTPQNRNAVTQQFVVRELIRQASTKDKGLAAEPQVRQALQDAKESVLRDAWLKANLKPAAITEEQVRARYNTIVASLGQKQYKASLIQVANAAAANAALTRIQGGEDFAEVARQVSLAPSQANGGAIGWISFKEPPQEGQTQGVPLPIARALSAQAPGTVSAPIALGDRYYLVKADEVRPTRVTSYEESRAGLLKDMQAEELQRATDALTAQLLSKAKITP